MSPLRRLAIALAVGAVLGGAVWLRRSREQARWWNRVERLCACNRPVVTQLRALASVPAGGLDQVALAQQRALEGTCDDLRAAMARRTLREQVAGTPLSVRVGVSHRNAQRDVTRTLALTCGEEHHRFWDDLRTETTRDHGGDAPVAREMARVAGDILRIRDGMCARRSSLSAPPADYVLTAADADTQGRSCGE